MVTGADGRRRRHTVVERRAVLERLAASGQSATAFCHAESISLATLRRWQSEADAVPMPVRRAAVSSGFLDLGALGGGGALTIELDLGGGAVLRVRRGD